ncbi:uncharacterized protein BT62DRAFT_959229 [Guyanagaster necrorhizus]|uniref:Amidohydrolase-related domain-containing protein n=1 Tax=Guyanagaster necrorhizus TaxID=856835 RepID=A0A9P7W5V0_9AGAR|nr:uncharacterized protein BT62DRAFT_959229 [Guyanagaster necrorhizus MCA 3950]KAG7453025.1 hypothetical protein BT62DRAFT_959229 [Guyanagaster necrorhizus MCA 3950]
MSAPAPRVDIKGNNSSYKEAAAYLGPRLNIRYLVLVICAAFVSLFSLNFSAVHTSDSAPEWRDNIWPYREQTPWDISTDFAYPRLLEYDVEEGTWLRLDVHPTTGDIVFDMLGDLYCIPGDEQDRRSVARARPVLLGVPYDSDPHFSPDGDRIVFRSDAGLGVENIWVMAWRGCRDMDVRPGTVTYDDRQTDRLKREGRLEARRVTNETFRWVSDARFHPSGNKIIASKWYTSKITLSASEGWEYDVPLLADGPQKPIKPQSGRRILGRTLPVGMTVDDYDNQQIGPEQFLWRNNDTLIYAKNVQDSFTISEGKDIHKGVYSIFSLNVTSGEEETIVDAFPGGASRPQLSRDGRTLAFVRRARDHEVLVLKDLNTGTIHHVFDGLTYDLSSVWAPMGTYPSFAFTPTGNAVIIWGAGQIHHIPLASNRDGERVASGTPHPIRFRAHIEMQMAETIKGGVDLLSLETQASMRVHAFKELHIDDSGGRAVLQAAGVTVVQPIGSQEVMSVPILHRGYPYYSPSFVSGSSDLIVHCRWSDTDFTSFEIADLSSGFAYKIEGLPLGRYLAPAISPGTNRQRKIAFVKTAGDSLTGTIVATARPGLYFADLTLPIRGEHDNVLLYNLKFIPSNIAYNDRVISLRFLDQYQLLVEEPRRTFVTDASNSYKQQILASGKMSNKVSVSADNLVAFVEFQHVYLACGRDIQPGEQLWAKPGKATKGLARLSLHGGHDVTWSGNGKKLCWLSGPTLFSLEVSRLKTCLTSIKNDPSTFGIECVKDLVKSQEIFVQHSTDIARLKEEAKASGWSGVVAVYNATLLTMETGLIEKDLIRQGVMLVKDGVIQAVGPVGGVSVPDDAVKFNANQGFVIPGFIDVHSHWGGYLVPFPAKSWEMQNFLAYGVTTMHNPSSDTVGAFIERSRLESGQFIGPRILTTGSVIFGGGWEGLHEEIVNMDEAVSALTRIRAEGGPVSLSYKNYQLPSRASRQRLLKTARDMGLLCVPEGGGYYDWDLTYIIDGMTTVEHALPVSVLYDDVLTLWSQSGTGSTPTHIVSYGGVFGEQYVWATQDIPNDPKLRRFSRHDILERLHESTARPLTSYALFNVSLSTAKMVRTGLRTHIGAHGEKPLGFNYHEEMAFTKYGGLTNYEVLQAATSSAAITFGLFGSVGSLSIGKLADFLIYPPDFDLLDGPIHGTKELMYVARGGRIWEAHTMTEQWPVKGRVQTMPPYNPDPV